MSDIAHKVAVIVSRELRVGLDRCTPDARLADLGADFVAICGIVIDIEDELDAARCSELDLIDARTVAAPRAVAA